MNECLERARDSFIEAVGELSASLGLSRVAGQLYGLLYLSERPVSLDEMVEILKTSKGNVSVNIRELEKWRAARKVWVKGSRRDYYQAEPDVMKVVAARLREGLQRRMEHVMGMIQRTADLVKERGSECSQTDAETARVYAERLGSVRELHGLVSGLLENISSFLG